MENQITEIVFILDKSGSMAGLEADTVGGYNSFLEKQKDIEGAVYISTVLFSTESTVIHDRADINTVRKMTLNDYLPCGGTALYDAIGDAIKHIDTIHKYARKEDVPQKTIFVITTDGMENSSHRYSRRKINAMITEHKAKKGWDFIFFGANIDTEAEGESLGFDKSDCISFKASPKGMKSFYNEVDFQFLQRVPMRKKKD